MECVGMDDHLTLALNSEVNDFSIYLILRDVLGRGVYSAANINEYQKQKNKL
jgi:hypothetical protein